MPSNNQNNLENVFQQKFKDYKCCEGRNLFPGICERIKQKKTSRLRYYVAASFSALIIGVLAILSFFYQPSQNSPVAEDINGIEKRNMQVDKGGVDIKVQSQGKSEIKDSKIDSPKAVKDPKPAKKQIFAVNEVKSHILPDQSEVFLKQGAGLTYFSDFSKLNRAVSLSGTAFFSIVKKEDLPFVVETINSVTTVVGTSFNLNSTPNRDEIFVSSGVVKFYAKKSGKSVELSKGMQAIINGDGIEVINRGNENTLAWKTKQLTFESTPLKDVFPVVEDYWGKKFEVKNREMLNCSFSGKFSNPSFKEFMQILTLSLDLNLQEKGDTVSVSGNGCN